MIYGHGDDIYHASDKPKSNFSSNVLTRNYTEKLCALFLSKMDCIQNYPEPDAYSLRSVIANKYACSVEQVQVTNGAIEAIYLLSQVYRGLKSTIVIPTFSEYEDACRLNNHELHYVRSIDEIDCDADLVWICNPNNPTGKIIPKEALCQLFNKFPNTVFVIDQSYAAFVDNSCSFLPSEVEQLGNLVLIQSLTKHYAIPGLRVGYIISSSTISQEIEQYKMPWSVNQLAIEAGKYLIEQEDPSEHIALLRKDAKVFVQALRGVEGIDVLPTQTHFVLCKLKRARATELKHYLITEHGILIRDASNFRGLNESYFRLACQTGQENEQLIQALKEWTA